MYKYDIHGIIGEGAYGVVYKAKNIETGQIGKKAYSSKHMWLS
jgi:serine/threonine protein kinase